MKLIAKFIFACLILLLTTMLSWSQTSGNEKSEDQSKTPAAEGLKKISGDRHDVDNYIDDDMLEANIEMSVNQALEVVRTTLQNLEIHIPAISVEPISLDAIDIDLKDIDINIDPVDIDLSNADYEYEHIRHEDVDHNQEKRTSQENSEKAKGLKKLN